MTCLSGMSIKALCPACPPLVCSFCILLYLTFAPCACRVKTQNMHNCVHQLPRQEANWGASSQYKDGWQEDAVRDVTSEVKSRVKRLPEAMYAAWRAVQVAKQFWTSHVRGDRRFSVHPAAFDGGEERAFVRVDDWGPLDDSRGRCLQTWSPPVETDWDAIAAASRILQSVRRYAVPCSTQCKAILLHFFNEHEVDEDLPEWAQMWAQQKAYSAWLDQERSGHGPHQGPTAPEGFDDPEPPDYDEEVGFQVYRTFKLGPGTYEVGDSTIYTRAQKKENGWFRYTAYTDPDYAESDNNLDYTIALEGGGQLSHLSPEGMMQQVRFLAAPSLALPSHLPLHYMGCCCPCCTALPRSPLPCPPQSPATALHLLLLPLLHCAPSQSPPLPSPVTCHCITSAAAAPAALRSLAAPSLALPSHLPLHYI